MTQSSPARRFNNYRRLLIEKRANVLAGIAPRRDAGVRPERFPEDDQAQLSHDQFVALHLNTLDYMKLRLIDEALDRLGAGDYGVCLGCDEPIPVKRLLALPWARYCVRCQEQAGAGEERGLPAARPPAFPSQG